MKSILHAKQEDGSLRDLTQSRALRNTHLKNLNKRRAAFDRPWNSPRDGPPAP